VDDIPVMLVLDKPGTHWVFNRSIRDAYFPKAEAHVESIEGVDSFVQESIVLVAGLLYRPLVGKLSRYPSARLDVEPGNGRLFLDIGSSWGRWTLAAARLGYRAVGIDPNLDAIRAARRVAAQQNVDADFVVGDARALPVRDLSVDVAFSYSVLQHFDKNDVRAALEQIKRKLSPNGYSLIQMANRAGVRSLYHQARRNFQEPEGFDVRYWSTKEIERTFSNIIGPSEIFADCYFGLGIQPPDADMLPFRYRLAVAASEILRRLSQRLRVLGRVADSVFVRSRPAGTVA
jgi:SAM-dependent methyltransferase